MSVSAIVNKILLEECKQDHELAAKVRDRTRKSRDIVKVRERVLWRLRTEVWYLGNNTKRRIIRSFKPPGEKWKPLSFPEIASRLGGNHSSWVKMMADIQRKKAQLTFSFPLPTIQQRVTQVEE